MRSFLRLRSRPLLNARTGRTKIVVVGAAAAIAVTLLLAGVSLASRSDASSTTTNTSPHCTRGMPRLKCESVISALKSYAAHPPAVHSQPHVYPALTPPALVSCGSAFFTPSVTAELTSRFGGLSCFRFAGQDRWVLIGNGMSETAATLRGTPGGSIVAVAQCAITDALCLNPDSTHSFNSFKVVRSAVMIQLQSTTGSKLLAFTALNNSHCGLLFLNIQTLRWYRGTNPSEIQAVLSRSGSVQPLRTGPAQAAAPSLAGPPPAASMSCP
jgi:hypothetical protein